MIQLCDYPSGPHINSLLIQGDGWTNNSHPKILWVACSDVVMDPVLEPVRATSSAMIMRPTGSAFHCESSEWHNVRSIVDDAVERLGVRDIVICGHSMCSGIPISCRRIPPIERLGGGDALWQRVQQREQLNARGQTQLIQRVKVLAKSPAIQPGIDSGDIEIHGLFYLAESGTFTRYKHQSGRFAPV